MKVPGITYIQGRNAYTDSDGRKYGLAVHSTQSTASARGEANYATTRTDGVSSHLYIDEIEIIQSIDTRDRCGHSGSSTGNENAICLEFCGFVSWSRQEWINNICWDLLGPVLRTITNSDIPEFINARASISEMKSNPKVRKFYSHDDMRQAWGGTTHTDPGPNFPWDYLFNAYGGTMATADDVWNVRPAQITSGLDRAAGQSLQDVWIACHGRLQDMQTELNRQGEVVDQILTLLQTGGGNADVAAILAGTQEQMDALPKPLTFDETKQAALEGANAAEDE